MSSQCYFSLHYPPPPYLPYQLYEQFTSYPKPLQQAAFESYCYLIYSCCLIDQGVEASRRVHALKSK